MSGDELHDLLGNITYVIPVEDGAPNEASLLQGFSPSLARNAGIIRLINGLPSDIFELTPEGQKILFLRRISGQAPVIWRGQSPRALKSIVTPPFMPFMVLFLGREHNIEAYRDWINAHSFPLTVVAEKGGVITYKDFSLEKLKEAFLNICDALEGQVKPHSLDIARKFLIRWEEPNERNLGYEVGGHNVVTPNVSALHVAGYRNITNGSFSNIGEGIAPYVKIIIQTTRSVLAERNRIGQSEANRYFRLPPSVNLFSPAIYPHFKEASLANGPFTPEEKKQFLTLRRMLERQDGYGFDAATPAQRKALFGGGKGEKPSPHPILRERATELSLGTECVGTLSASEMSAVIRLPNAVNRTFGQVRQFAQHYHAKHSTDRKRREEFGKVQSAVTASVPKDFFEIFEEVEDGIRIIADAPLEWMNVRGLPLCVQKNIARIPVTPGNLFIEQVLPKEYVHLTVSDFEEILILSALGDDDPISAFFDNAVAVFEPHFKNKLRVRVERIRNEEDLVAALNSYSGPMVIFDGHGKHAKDRAAELQLLEENINIWKLQRKRVRVPPIVVLSACDTHAADRNHASTANGFLAIGARTVLASAFPIDARDAASFVARLLYRVAEFVPAAHKKFSHSLTWMEIMGGMIRMQLLTDFCRRLQQKDVIDHETYLAVHLAGNIAINDGGLWPYELVIRELSKRGVDETRAWHELRSAAANSTAISYIQMGRPETIVVHPDEGFRDMVQAELAANE